MHLRKQKLQNSRLVPLCNAIPTKLRFKRKYPTKTYKVIAEVSRTAAGETQTHQNARPCNENLAFLATQAIYCKRRNENKNKDGVYTSKVLEIHRPPNHSITHSSPKPNAFFPKQHILEKPQHTRALDKTASRYTQKKKGTENLQHNFLTSRIKLLQKRDSSIHHNLQPSDKEMDQRTLA